MSTTLTPQQSEEIVDRLSTIMDLIFEIHLDINKGGAEPIGKAGGIVCEALAETQQLGEELVELFTPAQ